jgi:hypothetical protein
MILKAVNLRYQDSAGKFCEMLKGGPYRATVQLNGISHLEVPLSLARNTENIVKLSLE